MAGRHLATGVTLVVTVALAIGMAVWGYHALTSPLPKDSTASPSSCSSSETTTVKKWLYRKDVQISVYNAGGRDGEASQTLTALGDLGFVAGQAANAPSSLHVRRAVVLATKADDPAAKLVAANLGPNTRVVVSHDDLGPGTAVVVGKAFHHLPDNAPRRVKLSSPTKTCVSVS